MDTKIIAALVVAIALVGLTGSASAMTIYEINGTYSYLDEFVNNLDVWTKLETELTGGGMGDDDIHMHGIVYNDLVVDTDPANWNLGPESSVVFGVLQGGGNKVTIVKGDDKTNTFDSSGNAVQAVSYDVNGDAFDIDFDGHSLIHESTHEGILPRDVSVTAIADAEGEAKVSRWFIGLFPEASIKSGEFGYIAGHTGSVLLEDAHVVGAEASTAIVGWANAEGEIWRSGGKITAGLDELEQSVQINWPPNWP